MVKLSDSKIRQAVAKRALAIQAGHGLSKKKAQDVLAQTIAKSEARRAAQAKLQEQTNVHRNDILAEMIGNNPKIQKSIAALREISMKRPKRNVRPPVGVAEQPRISAGSILNILTPPYWNIWTQKSSGAATAAANSGNGTFGVSASGNGSTNTAFAGIAAAYFPISDSRVGHFRFDLQYSFDWFDDSCFYTAHSSGSVHAMIQEFNPAGNLVQNPPIRMDQNLWQDGTGWTESHSGSDDSTAFFGVDIPFPLRAGNAYALWLWCDISANDSGGSFAGFSFAQDNLQCWCPLMVVEESNS
jgi:hypothetical protein